MDDEVLYFFKDNKSLIAGQTLAIDVFGLRKNFVLDMDCCVTGVYIRFHPKTRELLEITHLKFANHNGKNA